MTLRFTRISLRHIGIPGSFIPVLVVDVANFGELPESALKVDLHQLLTDVFWENGFNVLAALFPLR